MEDTVAEGSSSVVIDELQHFEASHVSGLQHSSALSLIEEGWHSDHCILDELFYRGQQIHTLDEGFPFLALLTFWAR